MCGGGGPKQASPAELAAQEQAAADRAKAEREKIEAQAKAEKEAADAKLLAEADAAAKADQTRRIEVLNRQVAFKGEDAMEEDNPLASTAPIKKKKKTIISD